MEMPDRTSRLSRLAALAAGFVLLSLLLQQAVCCPAANAGNKELLEKWERHKQALKDRVFDKLRSEGKVPRDGIVVFTALLKPGADNGERPDIEIQSVEVYAANNAAARTKADSGRTSVPGEDPDAIAKIFAPRSLAPVYTIGEIHFSKGRQVEETISLRPGLTGGGTAGPVQEGQIEVAMDSTAKGASIARPQDAEDQTGAAVPGQNQEDRSEPQGWWERLWHTIKEWWQGFWNR